MTNHRGEGTLTGPQGGRQTDAELLSGKTKTGPKVSYGHIRLDISNSVLPLDKVNSPSPSVRDGMSPEMEAAVRSLSCELIQLAGKLLKLPQVAMATGCVLFQRFYYAKSFVRIPFEVVAMACVVLASKIEEAPRRMRDIINVFNHIKQIKGGKPITPVTLDVNYISLKKHVITVERRVLKELGFCVHVKHPHKIIVMYHKWLINNGLEASNSEELQQMAWNFMNDSLRTDAFVRYRPEIIAAACIYLSARKLKVPLPKNPSWFEVLGIEEEDIRDCCDRIFCLYNTRKAVRDELESGVDALRKKLDGARRANRETGDKSNKSSSLSSNQDKNGKTSDDRQYNDRRGADYEEEEPYHYKSGRSGYCGGRKKHKRSRSRSNEHRGRSRATGESRKHKNERATSQSPVSPYSPKRSKKHGNKRSRDYEGGRRGRRGDDLGANRGGCAVANDNPYYEDKQYKSGSRKRDRHRR